MLKLFNKEHVAIDALTEVKDYKIEYLLSGEDLLEFSLSISNENIHLVEEEGYIRTKNNEYVIKAIDPTQNFKRFSCIVNVEGIKAKSIKSFDTSNNNITDTIRLAIAGTGWILADNNITKRRTVRLQNTNALDVLREIRKVFRVDFRFDAINKKIYVYEHLGNDKGVYFSDELNLTSLFIKSDTYKLITRIIPIGKDGLDISSINNKKSYLDNFQYTNKVIEYIWKDERYTNAEQLKEDAKYKLNELSKPYRSYNCTITDLAKYNSEYSFLDFFLGDTITILSKSNKFRDKQRILKYIQYPNEPYKNNCELGNTTITFEDLQKENEYKNQIIDNITTDNGTVNGSTVDEITTEQIKDFESNVIKAVDLTAVNASITNLIAQNVSITGELNTVKANIGTLSTNIATIDSLTVTHTAQINDLKANSATITQLDAVYSTINTLEVEVGKIQTLVNGNLSSENIQAGGITSDKLTIANGFITNAMIANLDVSKINSGEISTNKFKIKSDDGGIEIVGTTQQFKDKNNNVRVQIGKDAQGNFNFIIKGEDGTTTLIDHNGIKANAIANDLIVSDMISSDSIGEKQINYNSFITGFNKDTNISSIKATKVILNNQNQTLDIAFNNLKTQSDSNKSTMESNISQIGIHQGKIDSLIANTTITKNGQTILLKDDYNHTVANVNSINSTLGTHTTQINQTTGKIEAVQTKINTVERDLNSITARVSSTETTTTNLSNKVNIAESVANNANNKIDNLNIGVRNLIKNSAPKKTDGWHHWSNPNTLTTTINIINESTSLSGKAMEIVIGGTGSGSVGRHQNPIIRPTSGKKYSWSIYLKASRNLRLNVGVETGLTKIVNVTTEWQKFEHTGISNNSQYYAFIVRGHGNATSGGKIYFHSAIFVEGDKVPTWTESPEDIQSQVDSNTTQLTATNSKVSSIETKLSSITSIVSSVENTQTTVNGKVASLETWKRESEQKITADAIISTVTKSTVYKNDLTGKVSTNQIISSINQTAESVKIQANKIELNGTTTVNGRGRHIRLKSNDLCFYESTTEYLQDLRLELGFQANDHLAGSVIPKIRIGCYGMNPLAGSLPEGNYILMAHFPKEGNPEGYSSDVFHLVHRNKLTNNWNGYRSFGDGKISIISKDHEVYLEGKDGVKINKLVIDDLSPRTFGGSRSSILMHCSLDGNGKNLGYSGSKFNQLSAIYIWGDSGSISDISTKENIRYLDKQTESTATLYENNNVENSIEIIKQNIKTRNYKEEDLLTKDDLFDFISNEIKICEYNYIQNSGYEFNENFNKKIGFIANEYVGNKVGDKIVGKHEGDLAYNYNNLLFTVIGALQVEIDKRKKLEDKIKKHLNI